MPSEWEKIAELVKASREALGVDTTATKPQLNVFDIPLAGAALEDRGPPQAGPIVRSLPPPGRLNKAPRRSFVPRRRRLQRAPMSDDPRTNPVLAALATESPSSLSGVELARTFRRMSQDDLAARSGTTVQTIKRVEGGERPPAELVPALAAALRVREELLG